MKPMTLMIMLGAFALLVACATGAKVPLELPSGMNEAAAKANSMGIAT